MTYGHAKGWKAPTRATSTLSPEKESIYAYFEAQDKLWQRYESQEITQRQWLAEYRKLTSTMKSNKLFQSL